MMFSSCGPGSLVVCSNVGHDDSVAAGCFDDPLGNSLAGGF